MKVGDYDAAVNLIVAADDLTKGKLVESDHSVATSDIGDIPQLTEEQQHLVNDALAIRNFLESNSSQLTYSGLFTLSTTLEPGLYAFFRNSHLSVLLKHTAPDRPLYTLVTDSAFAREDAVVWETLEDVDGSASTFVDASFVRASTAGGDYSGRSAEAAVRDVERAVQDLHLESDYALARRLQSEEDAVAQEAARRRQERRRAKQTATVLPEQKTPQTSEGKNRIPTPEESTEEIIPPGGSQKKKKGNKDDCCIM